MEKQRYITISEWMLELNLHPSELIVFALVYGFSQDGRSWYKGPIEYIQHWTGLSKRTTIDTLKALVDKGLLEKSVSGKDKRFVDYRAKGIGEITSPIENNRCRNFTDIGAETSPIENNRCRNFTDIGAETSPIIGAETSPHNNKDIDKKRDNNNRIPLPFNSKEFLDTWNTLLKQPKWKGKSQDALRLAAKKLGEHYEDEAIRMMEQSIMNGWQGIFDLKQNYGSKYEEFDRIHTPKRDYGESTL